MKYSVPEAGTWSDPTAATFILFCLFENEANFQFPQTVLGFLEKFPTVLHTGFNNPYNYIFQVAQSPVWWWLMYGVTCPCWTTGIWCPGWRWLAADTTAWCTTENSTPSEDWVYQGIWTTWKGKSQSNSTAACLQTTDTTSSSQLVTAQSHKSLNPNLTAITKCANGRFCKSRWMLSNPVSANKYSHCEAKHGRWCGMQYCGGAYCKSGWTGLLAFSVRAKGAEEWIRAGAY